MWAILPISPEVRPRRQRQSHRPPLIGRILARPGAPKDRGHDFAPRNGPTHACGANASAPKPAFALHHARHAWWRGALPGRILGAMDECCAALARLTSPHSLRSPHGPQIVSRPMAPKKRSAAQLAAAGRGSKATAAKHSHPPAAAEPVHESNDDVQDMQVDSPTDDPVGRRIDDVLTTAQTFNVAGFGKVRIGAPVHPICGSPCVRHALCERVECTR